MDLTCKNKKAEGAEKFNPFKFLPDFSNLVLENGSKNVRIVIQIALTLFGPGKILQSMAQGEIDSIQHIDSTQDI